MKINKNVYYEILFGCPKSPIETGGIIGGTEKTIQKYIMDIKKCEYGKYTPNIEFLSKQINSWLEKDIDFYGIYHTHYPVGKSLSQADIKYIKNIMISLSHIYNELYFPIVIPRKNIVVYKAKLISGNLDIIKDKLVIID